VPAHVAHEPTDVVGDQPADGPAGVGADQDLARRVQDEAGGLQVHRVRIDEGAGQVGDRARVGAEPDGEGQAMLGNEAGGGGFIVDRQGNDLDASVGQGGAGALVGAGLATVACWRARGHPVAVLGDQSGGQRLAQRGEESRPGWCR